jgi:hypothetical protein
MKYVFIIFYKKDALWVFEDEISASEYIQLCNHMADKAGLPYYTLDELFYRKVEFWSEVHK